MANKTQYPPGSSTLLLILKIVILFFLIGGFGAACGTKLVMLINGGICAPGEKAGAVFILVSACLAVPGIFLVRLSRETADRLEMPGKD